MADAILAIHFVWALWMIAGVMLAIAGFRWPRLWTWRAFRIAHLLALLGTATVPIWSAGVCPLTTWEWKLRAAGESASAAAEPFLRHWLREMLFLDVAPELLSIIAALGAVVTLGVFIWHPPRQRRSQKNHAHRDN